MPSDERTSLVPEVNSPSWRRKCCKHFSGGCFFGNVYVLLLVTDVVVSIHYNIRKMIPYFNGTDASISSPGRLFNFPLPTNDAEKQNEECIFYNGIDTLNCWIFLGIVTTSPRFVGCFTTLRNLSRLPRFWTLLFLLLLYVVGAVLLVIDFPELRWRLPIGCLVTDVLNAFTMVAIVGTLNHVEVQNLVQGHSRYKYLILKGALFVFINYLLWYLISTIFSVKFALFYATGVNNSDIEGSLTTPVTNVLFLPFVIKITDLIWTKIFHDEKCIIGECNKHGSIKQNSQI